MMWKCERCGVYFNSAKDLSTHKRINVWEQYFVFNAKKNIYHCKVCSENYKDLRKFYAHWDDKHDSYISERDWLGIGKTKDIRWIIRPMEEELIKHNLSTDHSYRALKSDFTVNELVINEIDHGVNDVAMTVIEIVGIPGVGKSLFALTLARIIQERWLTRIIELFRNREISEAYAPKIFIGFDIESTLKYLREAKKGDTIVQDEDPEMMGAHSGSTKQQIENIMKVMRKACVNFIFVSPITTPYINMPNMVFEVIAKNIKERKTKAALYDRKYHAVGWVIAKVLESDDPLVLEYEDMKDVNIERIRESGGRRSISNTKQQLLSEVQTVIDYMKSFDFDFRKRCSIPEITELVGMAGVEGDLRYQEFIARMVKMFMQKEKFDSGDVLGTDLEGKYLFIKEEEYNDPGFIKIIYDSLPEAMAAIEARSSKRITENTLKKFQKKHASAWYDYYGEGMSYDKVGGKYGCKGQAISNKYGDHGYIAIFQEEVAGDCAEQALVKKYFKDYNVIGGFGEPDLVKKDDKNDWIEIKIRQRLSEKISDLVRAFEYEFIDKGGRLRLALILYKQKECTITIFRVVPNPAYRPVDDIMQDERSDVSEDAEVLDILDTSKDET